MRLSIRIKMFILVLVVLLGATSAIILKTRSIFFEDKFDFVKQLSSKLSASTARLVSERMIDFQSKLATFVATKESFRKVKSKGDEINQILFERHPEFLAVSLQKSSQGNWSTEWVQNNPDRDASKWPDNFIETLLRSMNLANGENQDESGILTVQRLMDPEGNPIFAIVIYAEVRAKDQKNLSKNAIIGFLPKDFLADTVQEYKGDLNTVYLVDSMGYLISHPAQELIGNSLTSDDVVVKEIIDTKRKSATGEYKDANKETLLASYQPVERTNLFAIATTPMKQAMQAANEMMLTTFVFGLGFLVIGLVLAFVIASKITNPLSELKKTAAIIGSGDFQIPVNMSTGDEVGELASSIDKMRQSLIERDEKIEHSKMALVQSEKMSAFGQLSAGIAHEVKNPLAGILGHAQLAKSKLKDADLIKHMDVIEKEARRTKEIVENLMKFARAEKPDLVPTDIHEVVARTVDLVDHQLSLMGVKIHKHLNSVPQVMANGNQIQQVLLNLMMNAGHAMEETKVKELHVYTEAFGDVIQIRVKDTGKGLTPEVKKRLFEPFFTTKPPGKGTGLGLSVSFGIIRDHKGKIYADGASGEGCTFFIDLPKKDTAPLNSDIPVAGGGPQTKFSAEKQQESIQSSLNKAFDDFDKRRGIVTEASGTTTTMNGVVPNLDRTFKKPVSDPDKLDESKKDEGLDVDINKAQDLMYSDGKNKTSYKPPLNQQPINLTENSKELQKEEKIKDSKEHTKNFKKESKEAEIKPIRTVEESKPESEGKSAEGSGSFKVKIRKPNLKA